MKSVTGESPAIRVLIVDDSAVMRRAIGDLLSGEPGIEVVGTAIDGLFALEKIPRLKPDVVTLDLEMPNLDGLATLARLAALEGESPAVLVVSSHIGRGAESTIRALELGAVDVVRKPEGGTSDQIASVRAELALKVREAAASARRRRRRSAPSPSSSPAVPPSAARTAPLRPVAAPSVAGRPAVTAPPPGAALRVPVVAIGISTGGPQALAELLPRLPGTLPAAVLIVQHMPEGFTRAFAERLNTLCALEVKEAEEGDLVKPGRVLLARGSRHLEVRAMARGAIVRLGDGEPVCGHRPSADVLFRSVARVFGPRALGVIMTGMGGDGAAGLKEMRAAGARTLAQDEGSCVVYGMPRVAVDLGAVEESFSLGELAAAIMARIPPE